MDDPIINDPMYWKYQGLVESLYNTLKQSPNLFHNNIFFTQMLAHFAKRLYLMGYEDAMADYEPSLPIDEDKLIKVKKKVN